MKSDKLAKHCDQLWKPKKYLLREYKDIIKNIKPIGNVLNLGCGTGSLSEKLGIKVKTTGIDQSKGMLEKARKRYCLSLWIFTGKK